MLIFCFFLTTKMACSQMLFPYRAGQKWGFCDSSKRIIIEPKYQLVERFTNQNLARVKLENKYGYINRAGQEIIDIKYDFGGYFWSEFTHVQLGTKVGIINNQGKIIVPVLYDAVRVQDHYFWIKLKGKWGLCDLNGKMLSKHSFDEIESSDMFDLTGVKVNNKWGFVDRKGRMKIKAKFDQVTRFNKAGFCAVAINKKWGFINAKGKLIVVPVYSDASIFETNYFWVMNAGKWGKIDAKGKIEIPFEFDNINTLRGGLIAVKKSGKWGYIDSTGAAVIPYLYSKAFPFSEGLALVCNSSDSCGYINIKGDTILPFIYGINYGGEFMEGLAEVKMGDKYGFIDSKGETVIPIEYSSPYDINYFEDGIGLLQLFNNNNSDNKNFETKRFYFDKNGTIFYDN